MQVKDYHGKNVIDSREVAVMVERPHSDLMKTIRQYVAYLAEGEISSGDFFVESTYLDGNNQPRPNYLITKKGCDMIANKLTGKKGVLFTAAYVTAFEEMQLMLAVPKLGVLPEGVSLNGLARLLSITRRIMVDMGSSPAEIGLVAKGLYESCGVPLNPAFAKQLPGQISLFNRPTLES